MNSVLQPVDDLFTQKDNQIAALQAQIDGFKEPTTITDIQTILPEKESDGSIGLWYVARSAGAPRTGPHGTLNVTLGKPTIADFHPVVLTGGHSDNVYCLARLYPKLTAEQKTALENATKFSVGCKVSLIQTTSVQAFELDYQIRKSTGDVLNIGGQLLVAGQPTSAAMLRAFDYVNKAWVPLGPKIDLSTMLSFNFPVDFKINAVYDGKLVNFTDVSINGVTSNVTYNHPSTMSGVKNNSYLNAAYQLDGRANGAGYKALVDQFNISFS